MVDTNDIQWFKQQFGAEIEAALRGTPFTLDFLTAIACQETGEIWPILRKARLSRNRLLELCVGDTLDADKGRRAFPTTKADLLARPNGEQMFAIARQALVDVARYIRGYQGAAARPNKFCHGFGIFQYDLQHFLHEPDHFLQKHYAQFPECLNRCLAELQGGLKKLGFEGRSSLSDLEMAYVAIAYNTGGFKPSRGLKQGYFNGSKYYGEQVFDFLRLSQTVSAPGGAPARLPKPAAGSAPLPPPTPVEASGQFYEVDVRDQPLRMRSAPVINAKAPRENVIALLPDGQIVRAVSNGRINGFLEVETSLSGAHLRGFASAKYLKLARQATEVPLITLAPKPPVDGIVAVYMPRKPGTITTRTQPASAHSLNEPGQPGRKSTSADELRAELGRIIDWLAVDDKRHLRYQPGKTTSYCNVYAHDYCHLAGAYLPRVWWTSAAIEALAQGQSVLPQYGKTIDEQRANDLFRWLRDFGPRFGWRQTGTLTKLQTEVNQGAIGIIVAPRREDGRSGHIVAVVPETAVQQARRDSSGQVIAPLQSQAGATNFRYGTGRPGWWNDERFAAFSFWLHA
jgi:hypothetical protein